MQETRAERHVCEELDCKVPACPPSDSIVRLGEGTNRWRLTGAKNVNKNSMAIIEPKYNEEQTRIPGRN